MKKNSTNRSAFFNLRTIAGFAICLLGLGVGASALMIFHSDGFALHQRQASAQQQAQAAQLEGNEHLERDMPTFGEDPQEESESLAKLEQFWNDRLTYPTGKFNPAWLRRAAAQDARLTRAIPAGTFPKLKLQMNMKGGMASPKALSTTSFTALGPLPEHMTGCSGCYDYGTTEGRINDIVFDPTTTTPGGIVAYAGSVGGGVWKTTNCCSASTSWTVLTDDPLISTTSIDTITIDPNNHNTVYAGTGDLNFGSFGMGSVGILKSTDAGAHWSVLGADVFGPEYIEPAGNYFQYNAVGKVRVDPNNSNNVAAGTKEGLYLSNDGGTTWTQCATNNYSTQRQDITGLELTDMGGGVTRILTAIGTRGFATPVQYDLGNQGANGLYMATMPASGCPTFSSIARNDNGFIYSSTAVSGSPYAASAPMNAGSGDPYTSATAGNQLSRIDIAVAPSDPNTIYAQVGSITPNNDGGCGNANGCQLGAWASTDGGTTWTFMTGSAGNSLASCGTGAGSGSAGSGDYPQNWYDQGVAVDPNNADRAYFNTFETWLVTRTGTSWYDLTCGYNGNSVANHVVHVDHHAQAFLPGDSDTYLVGDDGGIHGTSNASSAVLNTARPTWFNMDTGINAIEFYSGDISQNFATDSAPSAVGGAQDNGPSSVSFSGTPTGPAQWQMGLGGDGFSGQINSTGTGPTSAQGTISVSGAGTVGQTFVIGPQTFTWQATRTTTGTVAVGTSANSAATNIVTAVNADIPTTATAARSGSSVTVTATVPGAGGNSITFVNGNSANLTFNGSGTLGGTTQGGLPGSPIVFWEGNNSGGLSRCVTACTSPGAPWVNEKGGWTNDTQSFVLPINLFHGGISGGDDCPNGCGHLLAGTTRVWETVTGNGTVSWYVTNNPTTQNLTKQALGNRSYINQVKYSPKFQSVAIVGTNDGNVQIGFNLGTGTQAQANWVDVTGSNAVLPNRAILGVALDPSVPTSDVPVAYAAVGGFNDNTPSTPGHIFQVSCASNCSTSNWVDKTGNLPNISADCVIVNPNYPQQVFAGTDWGLYFTNDITQASPTWYRFDSGLPHAMIWDMAIDRGSTTLSVWTRSRGAYVFPLPSGNLTAAAPILISAASRMTHAGAGTFDLPLPLTGSSAIEPRTDGAGDYKIVLNFNEPVNSGTANSSGGSVSAVSYSGNSMIISVSGVADESTLTVTASNVAGSNTQALPSASASVGILVGDVNGDGIVNGGDTIQVRNNSGNSVGANTFLDDVNIDGFINGGDATLVRGKSGDSLP